MHILSRLVSINEIKSVKSHIHLFFLYYIIIQLFIKDAVTDYRERKWGATSKGAAFSHFLAPQDAVLRNQLTQFPILTKHFYSIYFQSLIIMSVSCLHRWTIPHYSRGRQQEDRAGGTAGPSTHPTLERRQSVPVVPAQAGRPPRGHAASVCEEGKAVQSSCLGPDRWKWLEAHPNHIMGHRSGKCKYNNRHVREVESYVVNLKSLQIFLTLWRRNVCSCRSEQQSEFQKNGPVRIFGVETPFLSSVVPKCKYLSVLLAAVHQVILKGERGRGRSGEMAVDDITLRKGSCTEEHNLRRL